jgi:hypothetical protein
MSNQLPLVMVSGLGQRLQPGDMVSPSAIQTITNSDIVTQSAGMIVRGTGPGTCVLAQADTVAHTTNLIGARVSDVLAAASGPVLTFEPGLRVRLAAPAADGDEIYLSAAVAGVGTNVKPAIPVLLGYCFAYSLVGGIDYADLIPDQPQANNFVLLLAKGDLLTNNGTTTVVLPVGADGDVLTANAGASNGLEWAAPSGWELAYSNDFTLLTNQNLMTGGDGVKTLSDGSQVYVAGTARASNLSIVNGSGLRISALGTGTSSDSNSATAYWRMENLGNAALNRREWMMLRCSMIVSSIRPVAGSVGPSSVGGFYAIPAGNIVNGIPSWTFNTGTWISCQSRNWYNAGVSYEGAPYMGTGVTANQRGDSGYVLAVGAIPKDLYVVVFTRTEILIWLNSSVGSDFPADVLAGATLIGTYRPANLGSYDVTAVLAAAWEVTGAGGQTVYVTKMRCEYK